MKNYGNYGQHEADCENYDETITVSPLQDWNLALTLVRLVSVYGGKLLLYLTVMTQYKHVTVNFVDISSNYAVETFNGRACVYALVVVML